MPIEAKRLRQGLPPGIEENILVDAAGFDVMGVSPVGVLTPRFVGQEVFNTANSTFYRATGLANTNWSTGGGGGGGAGDAASVTFDPAGTIGSTNVQDAIEELDADISALSAATSSALSGKADASTAVTLTGTQTLANKTLTAPALGTPASGVLTNCTGYTVGNLSGLGTGMATFLGTPTSANLRSALTDESGSGALLFAGGNIGTPSAGVLSNCTGLPVSGLSQSSATSNQVIQWNGSAWAPATLAATGADDWDIVSSSNPASPYTPSTLNGNTVVKITALGGNLTINKPTGTFGTGKRFYVIFEITASGADRTITWGTGITLAIGVAPSLVVASGTTVRFVIYTDDNASNYSYDGDYALATETLAGRIEVATLAEINTGTDTGRAVAPDQLAGSYAGTKAVSLGLSSAPGDDLTTGDGKAWFLVPASLNGMNLVSVLGVLATAGSGGTLPTFQVRRVRSGSSADMLSTALTIDLTELTSATAATAAVINASNDDVATGDLIYIDIDAVGSTAAKGGAIVLEFRLP